MVSQCSSYTAQFSHLPSSLNAMCQLHFISLKTSTAPRPVVTQDALVPRSYQPAYRQMRQSAPQPRHSKLANELWVTERRRCSEIGVSVSGCLLPQRGESRLEDFVGHEFWLIAATWPATGKGVFQGGPENSCPYVWRPPTVSLRVRGIRIACTSRCSSNSPRLQRTGRYRDGSGLASSYFSA